MKINSEVLRQFGKRGFSIDEGIAVDARLVRSASKPISKDELEEEREKREGGGSGSKFSRDIDSDWTITKDGEPHFGLKEHVAVDVKDGFVLATNITKASEHESRYLPYMVLASCHTGNKISRVYGDKGYSGRPNREFLAANGIEDNIMRKNTTGAKLTEYEIKRNRKISKVRYIRFQPGGLPSRSDDLLSRRPGRRVEQYFGLTHLHDNGFRPGAAPARKAYRARFTDILKNLWDSMCRMMAFNIMRGVKLLAV